MLFAHFLASLNQPLRRAWRASVIIVVDYSSSSVGVCVNIGEREREKEIVDGIIPCSARSLRIGCWIKRISVHQPMSLNWNERGHLHRIAFAPSAVDSENNNLLVSMAKSSLSSSSPLSLSRECAVLGMNALESWNPGILEFHV
jgi:hypothetical protein